MGFGPNFKEFVQIGRDNAQVPKSFQQGNVFAVGPIEHAFIERENAVIAVKQRHACDRLRQFRLTKERGHELPNLFITEK
jgi:hypothetical protein